MFSEFRGALALTLTPVGDGRLEVYLDGETILDRKAEDGKYPGLDRVRDIKKMVRDRIAVAAQ